MTAARPKSHVAIARYQQPDRTGAWRCRPHKHCRRGHNVHPNKSRPEMRVSAGMARFVVLIGFSPLSMRSASAASGALLASGPRSCWTDCGRLIARKIGLFAAKVAIAPVQKWRAVQRAQIFCGNNSSGDNCCCMHLNFDPNTRQCPFSASSTVTGFSRQRSGNSFFKFSALGKSL